VRRNGFTLFAVRASARRPEMVPDLMVKIPADHVHVRYLPNR